MPQFVDEAIRRHGVPAELLTVEVTESALVEDPQRAQQTIARLKQRGVRMSIDDYGTGYSSLAYIQRLQFDELKVDRAFVTHMATQEKDAAIVRSTVELGHNLGLVVVAEGVEDAEVIGLLRSSAAIWRKATASPARCPGSSSRPGWQAAAGGTPAHPGHPDCHQPARRRVTEAPRR